jgi:hypothetical protein
MKTGERDATGPAGNRPRSPESKDCVPVQALDISFETMSTVRLA